MSDDPFAPGDQGESEEEHLAKDVGEPNLDLIPDDDDEPGLGVPVVLPPD